MTVKESNLKGLNDSNIDYIDYSKFEYNNWRIVYNNIALNALYDRGGAMLINQNANVLIKFSENEPLKELNFKKTQQRFLTELKMKVRIIDDVPGSCKDDSAIEISLVELMPICKEVLNPFQLKEYYQENGMYYKNTFKPTKYLKVHAGDYNEPRAIFSLIDHLVKYDRDRFYFIINWLANFFKSLKKSQIALVLLGNQGAGKGIFFKNIIKPLFGSEYCITINDESLNSKFKGGIIKNKLFFNFDEASHSKSSANKNFLKAIITNDSISAEEKNKTMESEIELNGQSLITSNDPNPVEIEEDDRRHVVFTTDENLAYYNFLGYRDYNSLIQAIEDELEDFAKYLKGYQVDKDLANEAVQTKEKDAIISSCTDSFKDFLNAIVNVDIEYFDELYDEDLFLYDEMYSDFKRARIKKQNIHKSFSLLVKGENNRVSAKKLLKIMRLHEPEIFGEHTEKSYNGNKYYLLDYCL